MNPYRSALIGCAAAGVSAVMYVAFGWASFLPCATGSFLLGISTAAWCRRKP